MFNSSSNGYSLSDIAAVSGNGGWGEGFGNGWWIILLFLFAWGNGGFFGGYGNSANGVTADIGYNFDMHDVSSGIRELASSNANGFYNLNTGMLTGFSNVQSQVANSGFDIVSAVNASTVANMQNTNLLQAQIAAQASAEALANCQLGNRIDTDFATLNYNLATEACANRTALSESTRDIIDSQNQGTRAILDFLVQDRITALTTENQALKGQISQSEQNAYLINALRPAAGPAYLVANPYTGQYGTYGYNAMYGGPITNGFVA